MERMGRVINFIREYVFQFDLVFVLNAPDAFLKKKY